MTRKRFIDLLRGRGIAMTPAQLEHLVASGSIPRPGLNERGYRSYGQNHLTAVEQIVCERRTRGGNNEKESAA